MRRRTCVRLGATSKPGHRAVPPVGRQQRGEHPHRGGLAGAVGAEEAVDLAGGDREVDAGDRVDVAEVRRRSLVSIASWCIERDGYRHTRRKPPSVGPSARDGPAGDRYRRGHVPHAVGTDAGADLFAKASERAFGEAQVVEPFRAGPVGPRCGRSTSACPIHGRPRSSVGPPHLAVGRRARAQRAPGRHRQRAGLDHRRPRVRRPALVGIDLVRLALERATTPKPPSRSWSRWSRPMARAGSAS